MTSKEDVLDVAASLYQLFRERPIILDLVERLCIAYVSDKDMAKKMDDTMGMVSLDAFDKILKEK